MGNKRHGWCLRIVAQVGVAARNLKKTLSVVPNLRVEGVRPANRVAAWTNGRHGRVLWLAVWKGVFRNWARELERSETRWFRWPGCLPRCLPAIREQFTQLILRQTWQPRQHVLQIRLSISTITR